MLKFFASQRNNTAVLLKTSLPAVGSSNLCNRRQNLKDCRRNMSEGSKPPTQLPVQGRYHVWSLCSNVEDSVMQLLTQNHIKEATIQCSGSFDEKNFIDFKDTTVLPNPLVTFLLGGKYYLSIEDSTKKVYAKPIEHGPPDDYNRFIHWNHYIYSMFESWEYRNEFLACNRAGELILVPVHSQRHPDARILFVVHHDLRNPNNER